MTDPMPAEGTPTPTHPLDAPTLDVTTCAGCGKPFELGQYWSRHHRLGVFVHPRCAQTRTVRGEDISTHTMTSGRMPEEDPATTPTPTPAVERAARALAYSAGFDVEGDIADGTFTPSRYPGIFRDARVALADALDDIDAMAEVLWGSTEVLWGSMNPRSARRWPALPDAERETYRADVRAIRTHLLGTAS